MFSYCFAIKIMIDYYFFYNFLGGIFSIITIVGTGFQIKKKLKSCFFFFAKAIMYKLHEIFHVSKFDT